MITSTNEASIVLKARIAGVLYLVIIITAAFAEIFVRGRLVIDGAAVETAAHILAHEAFYRLGGFADLINLVCDTALALLFYELFKPVCRSLSLLAACFRLTHVAILSVGTFFHFAPLILLKGTSDLSAFSALQLQEGALLSIRFHSQVYTICLVFFGVSCVFLGTLIYRSTFLPRLLGVMMAIAGLCYVTNSFAILLFPPFASHLFPYILLPGALGEWSLTLWLIVRGVDLQRWTKIANEGKLNQPHQTSEPTLQSGTSPAERKLHHP